MQILHIFILKAIKGEYQCGVHSVLCYYNVHFSCISLSLLFIWLLVICAIRQWL